MYRTVTVPSSTRNVARGDRLTAPHIDGGTVYFRTGAHTDLSDPVDTPTVRPRGHVLGERATAVRGER